MKLLASIGMLTVVALWAALALNFPQVVSGTATVALLFCLCVIWEIK